MICDYVVVGAGVVGLTVALELKRRDPKARVVVLDKEATVAQHASGRNSGVLHAGFYYSPDSLKARFTRVGNERMTAYCRERGLPLLACGKLVVAQNEGDLPRLDELLARGRANGVALSMISASEAREIEPRAITFERALWSPTTSTVDPHAVMQSLLDDARAAGIDVRFGAPFRATTARYVVNAAGLQADTIARRFGFARDYRILPFKGLYLYSDEPAHAFRTHVYPVPDPHFPFLGVHFTLTVDGRAKIGPTAIPALWREQYDGFDRFRAGELVEIAARGLQLAAHERIAPRFFASRGQVVREAAKLATNVRAADFTRWGKPGIRAQLYDIRRRKLEMDFVLEGDARSLHVLNAVSPGFTCAFPFAAHVADTIEARMRG
jgi:(S)-2-hydroxyglutarate dehydrogenase